MIPYFPNKLARPAIVVYFLALIAVSFVFNNYAMEFAFIAIGCTGMLLFFLGAPYLTVNWNNLHGKSFERKLFWTAFLLRTAWVLFSYFFYLNRTGQPFEFNASDELAYYEGGKALAQGELVGLFYFLNGGLINGGVSDTGYLIVLGFLNRLTGANIIITRLIKSLVASYACVLVYRLAARNFGEQVGKMAGVFYALMPNTIIYCGNHLKESFMVFIIIAFLERVDYLLKSKRFTFWNVLLPTLLVLSLFTFRTVLAAACLFALVTALLLTPQPKSKKSRRWALLAWVVLGAGILGGGTLADDLNEYWEGKDTNQQLKREQQTKRGNQWAKYATGTVMAPVIVAMPFSTMVDVADQQNQNVKHGGNFVRNYMAFFVVLALFTMVFRQKNWREHTLLWAYMFSYLGIIAFSGFANSERFLFPGIPPIMIFAAYGISVMNAKSYKLFKFWPIVVFAMEFGWAYFKVGSRGLL